jgi:hypothetical protein
VPVMRTVVEVLTGWGVRVCACYLIDATFAAGMKRKEITGRGNGAGGRRGGEGGGCLFLRADSKTIYVMQRRNSSAQCPRLINNDTEVRSFRSQLTADGLFLHTSYRAQ